MDFSSFRAYKCLISGVLLVCGNTAEIMREMADGL